MPVVLNFDTRRIQELNKNFSDDRKNGNIFNKLRLYDLSWIVMTQDGFSSCAGVLVVIRFLFLLPDS